MRIGKKGSVFLLLFLGAGVLFGAGRPLEFDDLLRARRISEPAISPDSRWVAFVETTYDLETCLPLSDIYLVPLAGGEIRSLTSGGKGNSRPMFTPDGSSLVFASRRSGTRQFYMLPLTGGGEALQLTAYRAGTGGGVLSPDGRYLLFQADVLVDSASVKFKDGTSEVRARVIDCLLFRHWNSWRNGQYSHLFIKRLKGGDPALDLTPGRVDCPPISLGSSFDYAASPDGRHVYYVANRDPVVAVSTNNDIWRVNPDGKDLRKITANPANDNLVALDPGGKYLAFRAMERPRFESDRSCLWLRNLENGEAINLTEQLDRSVGDVVWDPRGKYIYFTAEDEGKTAIFRVNASWNKKREIIRLTDQRSYSSLRIAPDGKTLVALRESFHEPAELVALSPDGKSERSLTRLNETVFSSVEMHPAESFRFPAEDGVMVQGFLIRPPGFDPGEKYPLIYLIHGGPQGAWTEKFHYRWNAQMWASWGYVVVLVNPRGSTGYGQRFTDEITGDWGGRCFRDLMQGLDYVIETYGFIEAERLAAAGASFGGYMINWINGHTDRFKALVCHAGVFNNESMYAATEELWFPEWEFGGTPWENPSLHRLWSPHRYAENFKTPTLVIHGELDFRVPVEQGLNAFTTLQRKGIDSKLLCFPNEGHWVGNARNSRLWHETIRDWLDSYLKQ